MCEVVAQGNDYVDYWLPQADDKVKVVENNEWDIFDFFLFGIGIIFIIGICYCLYQKYK